ncbi:ubiquitin-conjugating enzyme E2-binding protein [Biscogniauxia sp. FL1348]|nr:ubiquitin-conjugating enzyme E2-binding protein [Biscogniauxia sp. FL1348]
MILGSRGIHITIHGPRQLLRPAIKNNCWEHDMTSPHHVLIYAELLSNIRQISVGCTLPTPSSSTTKAVVSPDCLRLTVNHDGVERSIPLPGRVALPSQLPVQKTGLTNISWRLPLAGSRDRIQNVSASEEAVPWSAGDLAPESAVSCRACKTPVVEAGVLKTWRDLPSENWAEMMEFWHCHKPHDHKHKDGEHLASRGYGASSKISAQSGVGFIDLTSFLLSPSDISEPAVTPSLSSDTVEGDQLTEQNPSNGLESHNQGIFCSSCKSQLGMWNSQISSVSLFKWQVNVDRQHGEGSAVSPSLSHCISALLLATMARSGCSKSIFMPARSENELVPNGSASEKYLLNIWVFNGNITYSSTEEARSPINAVKVLYRMVNQDEADKMLDSMTSDVQDISLPIKTIEMVIELLDKSNSNVPLGERKFKDWSVGLLEKWNRKGT